MYGFCNVCEYVCVGSVTCVCVWGGWFCNVYVCECMGLVISRCVYVWVL